MVSGVHNASPPYLKAREDTFVGMETYTEGPTSPLILVELFTEITQHPPTYTDNLWNPEPTPQVGRPGST